MKTKNEILTERDELYSQYNSPKAKLARDIAKHDEYFLPYFIIGEKKDPNFLGLLFGCRVLYDDK